MSNFTRNVMELERKKLRAIQDKMSQGAHRNSHARAAGLLMAAETIAQRLLILLDNEVKKS